MDKELTQKLGETLAKAWDELQSRPNQYVVAYYRNSDDSLIGYHASTFCQITDDILHAKRYGGDPYKQMQVISTNLKSLLGKEHKKEEFFGEICEKLRTEDWGGMKPEDVWMDYIPLTEGTPKQECRWKVIDPTRKEDEDEGICLE